MNYKRKKPKKDTYCGICRNNRIGNSARRKNPADTWQPVPAKYPSWYCKRRKGKHDFVLKNEEEFWILPGTWQTFLCSSCGKKKLNHINSNGDIVQIRN